MSAPAVHLRDLCLLLGMLPVEWHKLWNAAKSRHDFYLKLQMVVADHTQACHAVHVMYQDLCGLAAALEAEHAFWYRQPSLHALQYWPLAFACK